MRRRRGSTCAWGVDLREAISGARARARPRTSRATLANEGRAPQCRVKSGTGSSAPQAEPSRNGLFHTFVAADSIFSMGWNPVCRRLDFLLVCGSASCGCFQLVIGVRAAGPTPASIVRILVIRKKLSPQSSRSVSSTARPIENRRPRLGRTEPEQTEQYRS